MLHLQRIRKRRVFVLSQTSCACFALSVLVALGVLLALAIKRNPGWRMKVFGTAGMCGAILLAVAGAVLAAVSLLSMRHRHFPQPDRRLSKLSFTLNLIAILVLLAYPYWLTWLGLWGAAPAP
jgi:hypothetical protein